MAEDKKQKHSSSNQQERSVQKSPKQDSKKSPLTSIFNVLFRKHSKPEPVEEDKGKELDEKETPVKTKTETEKSVEAEKSQTLADTKIEKSVEAEKSQTLADTKTEKSVEAEKSQTLADTKTEKSVEAEKSQTLADTKTEKSVEAEKSQTLADTKTEKSVEAEKSQALADTKTEKSVEAEKSQALADTKGERQIDQEASVKTEETKTKETKEQITEPSSDFKIENAQLEDKVKKQIHFVKLEGLFAFKMSMSTFYNEKGESVPVTALKYEPCRVSQIKSQQKESYEAVQVAFKAQKNKRCSKALIGHLKPSGFKEGARFVKEIRQTVPKGIQQGQELSIESLKKGDIVKISAQSKGRGFSGVMKRWNFAGGKASHGSKSHRRIGSIGQHTEPARVFPGRKMPGQYGFKKISRLKVPIVDVLPEEGIIFVKGPVPGARNTLVSLRKMPNGSI